MSFGESKSIEQKPVEMHKFPLRRLEPSISKFLKVIEIDLDRLQKHKTNIEKFNRLEDWDGLNREQINATRTVQQISSSIREMEKMRKQVKDEDLGAFDAKTVEMKNLAQYSVMRFLDFSSDPPGFSPDPCMGLENELSSLASSSESSPVFTPSENYHAIPLLTGTPQTSDSYSQSLPSESVLLQTEYHSIPDDTEAMESWEDLHKNLVELNTLIHDFSTSVEFQGQKLDHIEENIEKAHGDVREGVFSLGKASKYKAALFPMAGAAIGTVFAGPIGFVAGAKIGGVIGVVGGGISGYLSGKYIKTRHNKVVEAELKNISNKRSSSESEAT